MPFLILLGLSTAFNGIGKSKINGILQDVSGRPITFANVVSDGAYPTAIPIGFLLCLIFGFLSAQPIFPQSIIQGSVKDSKGLPMPFANVLLLHPADSSLVKGAVSDEVGHFSIQVVPSGNYLVTTSMLGFRTVYSLPLTISNNYTHRMDFVLEEDISDLSEVLIQANKPLFEQQMGRLVVNVKSSVISSGSNVLDVLARTPGITVNQQNNSITINGKEGVMIMLNDKMVRIPLSALVQMLSGMSADQVEKIEIISSPPARYDSEGNAGLINIVSVNNLEMGTNGSFSSHLGHGGHERFGASLNLNHRTEKINFYVDYSGSKNHNIHFLSNLQRVDLPDQQYRSEFKSERDNADWNQHLRTGIEYVLSQKTLIGSQFSAFSTKRDQLAYNVTEIAEWENPTTLINVQDIERNHWWNLSINLNMNHRFTPDQDLSLDLDYLYFFHNNPHDYLFNYQYVQEERLEEEVLVIRKITPIKMWVGKTGYQYRVNENLSLEAGMKVFFSEVDNKIETKSSNEETWLADSLLNQHMLMEENIGAGYFSLNANLDSKTKLQSGLRYEHTYTFLETIAHRPILERNYGDLFPTVSLSRDLDEKGMLQLSYSRRITRPTFNDLAPFLTLLDPSTFISGNLALLPSKSNSLQANFQLRKNYTVNMDFTQINDAINWDLMFFPEQNIQIVQKNNFDKIRNLSITVSAPNNFYPWWEGHNSIQGIRQNVKSVTQEVPILRKVNYLGITTTQTLKIKKGFSAELSGFYQSRSLAGLVTLKSMGSLNFGIQKELKENKGTIKIAGEDLLWTQRFSLANSNSEKGFKTDLELKITTRVVRLSYSLNFGNKQIKSVKRDTGSEEERKRVQ